MKQALIIPLLKFESKELPFRVQTIKSLAEELDEKNDSPHNHNHYEMIWMIEGKGKLYVDLQEHTIENNMLFCLRPGQAHQFQPDSTMDGFVFTFTDTFLNLREYEFDWTSQPGLLQLFSKHRVMRIQNEAEANMRNIALQMKNEYENNNPFKMQLLKGYFKILLLYLARQIEKDLYGVTQSRETELVTRFMEMLERDFKQTKMVAEYAARLSITPNYLNGVVKKNTGLAAGHHIRQRIVLEAKRMCRYSNAGMKEIAYNLGFTDSAHFSKFFKSVSGSRFSDFKKGGISISMIATVGCA